MYDADGYPTDSALDALSRFEGTPAEMIDTITELFNGGGAEVIDRDDDFDRPVRAVRLVTLGWSGCESVVGALNGTMFHYLFWSLSARGGLHVYEVGHHLLHTRMYWGRPEHSPAAG